MMPPKAPIPDGGNGGYMEYMQILFPGVLGGCYLIGCLAL